VCGSDVLAVWCFFETKMKLYTISIGALGSASTMATKLPINLLTWHGHPVMPAWWVKRFDLADLQMMMKATSV